MSNLKKIVVFVSNTDLLQSYFNHNAEGYHAIMMLFSDRATPVSYRYADIFSINTYKFTQPVSLTNAEFKMLYLIIRIGWQIQICQDSSED